MWEKMKSLYKAVIEKVVEVEKSLDGKTGEEKRNAVVEYLVGLIDISFIPDFIEAPVERALYGYVVDLIVDKLNWLNDWDFKDAELTPDNIEKIAEVAHAPAAVMSEALSKVPAAATIEDKLNALYTKYKVEQPVKSEAAPAPEAEVETVADPVVDNFPQAIAFTLRWEGGKNYTGEANGKYVMLNPADKGGPTNMGITKGTLAAAYAQGVVKHNNLDVLTKDEASAIYRANFWERYGWGELASPACLCAFDCSVNHGGFAWILQRACVDLGAETLVIDGKYGPATRETLIGLAKGEPQGLAQAIANQRKAYYDNIVAKDAGQKKNLAGWYNRLRGMAEAAGVKSPV